MSPQIKFIAMALALSAALCGCKRNAEETATTGADTATPPATEPQTMTPPEPAPASEVVAQLQPTEGNQVSGTVTFMPMEGGMHVIVDVSGLTPGMHGFHIHENGDCSAPDATSAGNHYNPENHQHGGPDAAQRHVGDFGNLEADASGRAQRQFMDANLTLEGANSIIGRAVIIHAKADDLKTQPSGNAGARVACGVIGGNPGVAPAAANHSSH